MTGVIDYNAGNIKSVERALDYLKAPYVVSKNPLDLENADRIIFPGVGEASYAMEQLKKSGFDSFIKDWALSDKPLMGICLGSQIVFDYSEEGDTQCLGLLHGTIRHFSSIIKDIRLTSQGLKFPHMGWNSIKYANGGCPLLDGIEEGCGFYFVHSYVIQPEDDSIIKGYADYGIRVPSVIHKDNISVFQFHPEKSGTKGLRILHNYVYKDLETQGGL